MADIQKATLQILEDTKNSTTGLPGNENIVEAQFNPQTLQVTYSSTGSDGSNVVDKKKEASGAPKQLTGTIATVSFDLLFDTTDKGSDVRQTTLKLVSMMRPAIQRRENIGKPAPPVPRVRFHWGTFLFYGQIQSLSETLDFFSESGVPLRSTVKVTMTEEPLDRIDRNQLGSALAKSGIGPSASTGTGGNTGPGFSASSSLSAGINVGTTPLTLAQAGDSLQALVGRAGLSASWQTIAAANNIDNPRLIPPGTPLNLNVSASARTNIAG
jgi:hypothetical protein